MCANEYQTLGAPFAIDKHIDGYQHSLQISIGPDKNCLGSMGLEKWYLTNEHFHSSSSKIGSNQNKLPKYLKKKDNLLLQLSQ